MPSAQRSPGDRVKMLPAATCVTRSILSGVTSGRDMTAGSPVYQCGPGIAAIRDVDHPNVEVQIGSSKGRSVGGSRSEQR